MRVTMVCAVAVLWAACVPIPRTTTLAPPVVGTLTREDRTPVAGARLVLSVADNDSTCTSPSSSTTVDPAGRFAFPAVRAREQFTVVLFERLLCYRICGGGPDDPIYSTCSMHTVSRADTLSCVAPAVPTSGQGDRTWCIRRPRRGP